MLERLGLVLGWIGNILAAICILIAVFVTAQYGESASIGFGALIIGIGTVFAAMCWGAGRALRFIFTGT
jgi:hypothetical protein